MNHCAPKLRHRRLAVAVAVFTFVGSASTSEATELRISVTNHLPAGGFALTPFWLAVHDGTFDMFDPGVAADAPIETLAELGNAAPLGMALGGAGVSTVLTSGGPVPPLRPGDTNMTTLQVAMPGTQRFFSYASMVVPSNDLFVANGNPLAFELFDMMGNFLGDQTIEIHGARVWDAGTEVNNVLDGGAFVQGIDATLGTEEGGVVHLFFSRGTAADELESILGTMTPPGDVISSLFGSDTLLATITITAIPEPSSLALGLIGVGLAALVARRKKAKA